MLPLSLVWYLVVYSLHPFLTHSPGIGTYIASNSLLIQITLSRTFLCVSCNSLYEDFSRLCFVVGLWGYSRYVNLIGLKLPQITFLDGCIVPHSVQEVSYFLLLLPTLGIIQLSKFC